MASLDDAAPADLRVALPGPLDLVASLERFRRWGDDLLERFDGTRFVATAALPGGGRPVAFAARPAGDMEAPALDVRLEAAVAAGRATPTVAAGTAVGDHVRGLFVADPADLADLAARDPIVAVLEARYRGLRPVLQRDPFTALVRSISAQQVNLAWAATTRRRLAEAFGRIHCIDGERVISLDPLRLAEVPAAELRALQFTTAKAEAIVALARAVAAGGLGIEELAALPDEAVEARLVALRGIGPWTAEWFLARTLGRPRVVAGDLGVRKAVGAAYLPGLGRLPTEAEVRAVTGHWGAAAGVVQQLFLHWLGDGLPRLAARLGPRPAARDRPAARSRAPGRAAAAQEVR